VLLAIAVVPLSVWVAVWGNWTGYELPAQSLIAWAVAGLFALVSLNRALQRRRPRWVLSPAELIAVYSCMAISTGLCASPYDFGGSVSGAITWPVWHATPGNRWEEFMWPNLPRWLLVTNREALAAFFMGDTNPYQPQILLAWLRPTLWWTAWTTALLWVSLCLNVIVRKRWSQEEQLPFPMTVLPLQMSQEHVDLFRSPLFWFGFAAAVLLGLNQAASRLAPAIPTIPTGYDYSAWVANNKPWDAIRIPAFGWEPWQVGLIYLMPLDLAFSLVVFNVFWRAEYILSRQWGWSVSSWGGFPYGEQQTMGAYFALIGIFLWLERRYLAQVFRKALGLRSVADDGGEPFSYRTAVIGAVAGMGFVWWFLGRAGVTPAILAFFVPGYFLMVMMMSRLRAQLGPPSNEMWGSMPDFALTQYPGTRALGGRTLGMLGLLRPYLREQTANPAPTQLETLRMAQVVGARQVRLGLLMVAIVPLGMLTYFLASMTIGSHIGLGSGSVSRGMVFHSRITVQTIEEWLTLPGPPDWGGVAAIGVGAAVVVALMGLKLWLPLWPLHPVAFPLGFDMTVDNMLPALVLTWLVKAVLLRYGGLRAHRKALPFFLGLIVGSAVTAVFRVALSGAMGFQV